MGTKGLGGRVWCLSPHPLSPVGEPTCSDCEELSCPGNLLHIAHLTSGYFGMNPPKPPGTRHKKGQSLPSIMYKASVPWALILSAAASLSRRGCWECCRGWRPLRRPWSLRKGKGLLLNHSHCSVTSLVDNFGDLPQTPTDPIQHRPRTCPPQSLIICCFSWLSGERPA